ncbi:5-formyltetrahydrofolate cyclo-ligase [Candidatus Pelagibacter sp.]|nr:5-formyltetrahydrofolate cyclo-ligase [Candidatus Pelagibacter sp.]
MNKAEIRKKIFLLRKKNYGNNLSIDTNKLLKFIEKKKIRNKIIGGYYPYNYEIDVLKILEKLEKKNYSISFPKIGDNNKMSFYQWSFKDPLSINIYGIPEPISKKKVNPEILLVPLVAFDSKLNRLGYGGGYYDRYISRQQHDKKIIKIGLGFSFQKIDKLPINQYDKKLDYIITEKNFF